jgi:Na+/H+ antiporter NhaC
MMFQTMMILMLAWTLGEILRNDLSIGKYLAELIYGSIQLLFLPLFFFLISLTIAFATGTSWGTAAVMLPIAIPTTLALIGISIPAHAEAVPLLFPVIGAVFSGCIAGDHLSPISDTTIMTSSSTRMPHIDHVRTQMGYAIPMVVIAGIGFIVSGWLVSYGILISLIASTVVSFSLIAIVFEILHRKAASESPAELVN